MMSEWKVITLGEFCPFKYGKGLPSRDRRVGEFSVYSSAGLIGSHTTPLVETSGVVIGRKGTVGSVNFSPKPFWPIDTSFYVEDDPAVRDIRFTYYLLKTLGLDLMNTDTAVPGLNRDNVHALEVSVPSIITQKKIADFLGALDDRITLLRETNSTLEAIAQALFKSWFVDFDPVHAKSEGRKPEGMEEATVALFPDSFEESELGLIPKAWRLGKIADISKIKGGFAFKSESFCDAGFPVIKIKNIVGDGTVDLNDIQYIKSDIAHTAGKFALYDGDIVIAMTGATIGKTGIVVKDELTPYLNQRVAKLEENLEGKKK